VVFDKTVNTAIPDNNPSGLVSSISVSGVGQAVSSIEVVLSTQNGWNGDLYAYLEHDGIVSVLLNRSGRTATDSAGAASSGMLVRLSDSALVDSHTAISDIYQAFATGTYQPDARGADPDLVTDASSRSMYLSGFGGHDADGDWTLFVADLSGGDVATLSSWSLSVTTVPEPSGAVLAMLGATGALFIRKRRERSA